MQKKVRRVSPATAIIVITLGIAAIVFLVIQLVKPDGGVEQTPKMVKIQNEIRDAMARSGGGPRIKGRGSSLNRGVRGR